MKVKPPGYLAQHVRKGSVIQFSIATSEEGKLLVPSDVSQDEFMSMFVEQSQMNIDMRGVGFKKRAFQKNSDLKRRVVRSLTVSTVIHALASTGSSLEPVTITVKRGAMECRVSIAPFSSEHLEALEDVKEKLPQTVWDGVRSSSRGGIFHIDTDHSFPSNARAFVGDILEAVIRNVDVVVVFSCANVAEDQSDEIKELFILSLLAALRDFFVS